MRPTFDRRLWILLYILLIQCIVITNQQNIIKPQNSNFHQHNNNINKPAASIGLTSHNNNNGHWNRYTATAAADKYSETDSNPAWSISTHQHIQQQQQSLPATGINVPKIDFAQAADDNIPPVVVQQRPQNIKTQQQQQQQKCAKNCSKLHSTTTTNINTNTTTSSSSNKKSKNYNKNNNFNNKSKTNDRSTSRALGGVATFTSDRHSPLHSFAYSDPTTSSHSRAAKSNNNNNKQPSQLPSTIDAVPRSHSQVSPATKQKVKKHSAEQHSLKVHTAHRSQHKEVKWHRDAFWKAHDSHKPSHAESKSNSKRTRRSAVVVVGSESADNAEHESISTEEILRDARKKLDGATAVVLLSTGDSLASSSSSSTTAELSESDATPLEKSNKGQSVSSGSLEDFTFPLHTEQPADKFPYHNKTLTKKPKRARSTVSVSLPAGGNLHKPKEPIIIIDDVEEFDSGTDRERSLSGITTADDKSEDYSHDEPMEPRVLPLRPVLPNPYEDEEMSVVYAEQHSEIILMCEVDLDIDTSMWYKNGQVVHAMDRTSRATDYRFIKEPNGALTITNVMLEDDGKWQCEAENIHRYTENARSVKLVVLDRPKPPYLLIDSRRLDAGNIFVPVKENSELNLACVSEGGNPKPTLTWEVLLSPGVDRHAQKVSADVLELEEIKNDKDKNSYKINSGAKSEARLPAVYRAHHNARILCVMEHPTLKIRQNASLLLDVQYTPSFAISRTPGFGYPLREGIEVSLKCDVDSNPPSTPRWQKDDGDTPVPQTGDGFLNFTSIRREHSGWYKCTSRHLNFQYSSIGYYLSVRYDSVDVTSEPDDQDISVAAASHNPNKGQLEVQLGGAVTLQCPQGSLGCWSHLDPVTARLRGLGYGLTTPTGQFSLKDVVYQDAGTYKCIGQSLTNKKKLEVLQTVGVTVKGAPTVVARNATPVAYPGSPLHLAVEFCANPPAYAARWLHGDRVFTPGNQYGSTVLAYGVTDLPTPYCKEARLTYVSMHERVPRTFYFIVSSPGGVAEAVFKVNFTMRFRPASSASSSSNAIDDEEEELSEPEEIHFPVFGASASRLQQQKCLYGLLVGVLFAISRVWRGRV